MSIATEPVVETAPPEVRDRRVARRLVIAAALSTVVCMVIYVLLVRTPLGHRFDNAALIGAEQQVGSAKITDETMLQRISAESFALVLGLIVLFGVVRRRARLGLAVAVAAGLSVVGTDLLRKGILGRQILVRSDAVFPVNTFPSGHTATAISCALALVVVSPPAWRGISALAAGSYACFTAAAVQTAGWHRPSDAIGAAFLSFAVVSVLAAWVAWKRPIGTGTRFAHVPAFLFMGLVWLAAAGYSALNAARVLRFLSAHPDSFTPTHGIYTDAYHFSIGLTVVVVVSLLAVMLVLLGRADLDEPRSR